MSLPVHQRASDTWDWVQFQDPSIFARSLSLGTAGSFHEAILQLFKHLIRAAKARELERPVSPKLLNKFTKELQRFYLWGDGFSASEGELDEILAKDSKLRHTVLSLMLKLSGVLSSQFCQLLNIKPVAGTDVYTAMQDVKQIQEEVAMALQPEDDLDFVDDASSLIDSEASYASENGVLDEITTYIDCLMDLCQVLENVAMDAPGDEDNTKPQILETFNVSSQAQAYCRKIRDQYPHLPKLLVERLGEHNASRASRVSECKSKPGLREGGTGGPLADEKAATSTNPPTETLFSDSHHQTTDTTSSGLQRGSVFDANDRVVVERPKVMRSRNVDEDSDAGSTTSYATFATTVSTKDEGRPRVPTIPQDEGDIFTCIACNARLSKDMERARWKKHIFDDLRPYCCTFEQCTLGPETFMATSTRSWAAHELQHRQRHPGTLTVTWACLFCGPKSPQLDQPGFFRHVSRHLQEVALAALPQVSYDVGDSEEDDLEESDPEDDVPIATISSKRLLGLDDPRVIIQYDRGASHYIQDHPFPSSPAQGQSDGSDPGNALSRIFDQLYGSLVPFPEGSHNFYIPNSRLRDIMTRQNVFSVVMSLPCFSNLSREGKERVCDKIFSKDCPRWRLLAALLLLEREDKLASFLEDSVSDECLPIAPKVSHCRVCYHSRHKCLGELNAKHRDELSRWSYAVNAPYFKSSPGQHFHLVLDGNDRLPITKISKIDTSNAPSHQKSGHVVGNAANGGFGEVQKVTFDSSHFNFDSPVPGHPASEPDQYFALKRLYLPDRENFNRELASLLSITDRQDEHLIKLLVTFEIRNEQGSTFYLLFPWAEGDLWLFWKRNDAESKRIPLGPWMAEQCYRIANVLKQFHNAREELVHGHKDIKPNERSLYGRHGDLKADNILWFPGPAQSTLVLADFGLARLHSIISRSRVDPLSIEKTATYRAPEFDLRGGFISRASDIFSLGCMYLEFVTWYLEGWESVSQTFVEARSDVDVHGINSDVFFHIEGLNSDAERAVIKPQVIDWINRLKANPRCSYYILMFLDLIENDMLEPDSNRRAKSSTLVPKLHLLSETCRRDSDFWKVRAKP
ncbi:hypothetical protein B0T19DRAFT_263775 [Cercophora scortea]|uniref:Protein kinase domain-containing protein n=1 Tax=Cercophora scortea TaxID=314031 RepID=A0AAE0IA21_9PEZI|nr:hypothetical protein B0T19DRAFT_263775 [Cercophora scortea]